jgi:hypothetical protein
MTEQQISSTTSETQVSSLSYDIGQAIIDHLPLVRKIARKTYRRFQGKFELDDLEGYGNLGLTIAAQRYDISRAVPFEKFAYSGLSGADLETACVAKLDVDPSLVKDVIAEARKRLTLAAEYNRDELLGTALTRLNDFYSRCIRAGADGNGPNLAKALDVQREINRLVGLYRQTSLLPGQGTEGGGEASDELRAIGEPAAAGFPSAWRTRTTRSANMRGWRRRRSVNIKQPKQRANRPRR